MRTTLRLMRIGIWAAMCGSVVWARQAPAQRIIISEPSEWADSSPKPLMLVPGKSVVIKGYVEHPTGVQGVLVNGERASVAPTEDPSLFLFQITLAPEGIRDGVTITILPKDAQRYEKTYATQAAQSPQPLIKEADTRTPETAKPPVKPPDPVTARDTTAAKPAVPTQLPVRQTVRPRPKALRFVYGGVAIAGLAMSQVSTTSTSEVCRQVAGGTDCFDRTSTKKSYQAVGYGLAAGAVLAILLDARSGSHSMSATRDDLSNSFRRGTRLTFDPPRVTADLDHATLELLRIRFR